MWIFKILQKFLKWVFVSGVDYIHGEVMYVKRHAIHQIEGDDYRPFETHVFIPNSKKVCISFLYMFKVTVNVFSSYLSFIQLTITEPIFGFFLEGEGNFYQFKYILDSCLHTSAFMPKCIQIGQSYPPLWKPFFSNCFANEMSLKNFNYCDLMVSQNGKNIKH